MKRKTIIAITTTALIATTVLAVHVSNADTIIYGKFVKYKDVKNNAKIDGTTTKKIADIRLKSNKEKNASQFKSVESLDKLPSVDTLKKDGGEIKAKLLMTYEDSVDKDYAKSVRYDVDPNRMVWVVQTKYNKDLEYQPGVVLKKPLVTNILDAETGEVLFHSWKGENDK